MEFVSILLILVIILLIVLLNKANTNYHRLNENNKRLNENLKIINRKISSLISNGTVVEEQTKPSSTSPPALIKKPTETPEEKKPALEAPISKPIIEEEKPKALSDVAKTYHAEKQQNVKVNTERPKVSKPPKKSLWEQFKEKNPDLEKFVGENLINKLGVLILVLGISYFVKYAIDRDWINEPARVGIGILCGSLVMLIANKLRKKYAAFSSVLVSGAIAIFYFTIAIAFHEYKLFNQQVAFAIMVIITIFSGLISLSYNRIELAVLSLVGGFAVPFMVSTGSGNYVVLFTYIIILNIGIIVLAFYKKWNLVNTLAFIFTVLLFGGWFIGDINSNSPHYVGSLIFAFVFYLIFIITNIINNVRTKAIFTKIQLAILGVSTFFFFAVGMIVLNNYKSEFKGLFTAILAIINLFFAWFLYKKFRLDKTAVYLLIGLTLTFITLAVPLQFKGNYITLFWAAEAVLLMWLAKKSNINSYRFASLIVHVLAIVSLLIDWTQKYNDEALLQIIINPIFATGICVVGSLFLVYFLIKKEAISVKLWKFVINTIIYKKYVFIIAILFLYLVGFIEAFFQSVQHIDSWSSALSVPAVYHLVFTAVVALVLFRKNNIFYNKVVNIISCINIILFVFMFSHLPFEEHNSFIETISNYQIAFYLHYVMLAIVVFFGILIYKSNKDTPVFSLFNNKIFIWIAAFLFIFIATSEVLLHGLKLLTSPIGLEELKNTSSYIIDLAEQKVIKTAYPVLWGILAFIFLIFGIKKQIKSIRIIALTLIGITIVKLFVYDISNISETGKIIAFILLGILILIISFVYQKIKVLVIDDNKESN